MPHKTQKSNTSGGSQQPQFATQPSSRRGTDPAPNEPRDQFAGGARKGRIPPQENNNYHQPPRNRGNPGCFNPGNSGQPYIDPMAFSFVGGGADYNLGGPVSLPQPSGVRVGAHPRSGYAPQGQNVPDSQGRQAPQPPNGYAHSPPNYPTSGKSKHKYSANMQDYLKNDEDNSAYWRSNGGPPRY